MDSVVTGPLADRAPEVVPPPTGVIVVYSDSDARGRAWRSTTSGGRDAGRLGVL